MENLAISLCIAYVLHFIFFFYVIFCCVDVKKHNDDIANIKHDVNTFVGNTYCDLQCNVDKLYNDLQKCKREINKLKNKVGK